MDALEPVDLTRRNRALTLGLIATALIPLNTLVLLQMDAGTWVLWLFMALGGVQFILGMVAAYYGLRYSRVRMGTGLILAVVFTLVGLGGPVGVFAGLSLVALASAGGAWGRPLRLRGRVIHPDLREGTDWTRGETPDVTGLDTATRTALEALWLHDAQKEHASVPAFARVSWLLAGVGAPASLTEAVHVAALEEIDHTRRCFALAAGYGGRAHTAEPMPDLLLGGLEGTRHPWVTLAVESLTDGCLLEDYNADVAAACEAVCETPVTRAVLAQIAREERSHAELSWAILAFCLSRGGDRVLRAVRSAVDDLATVNRPTATSAVTHGLVAAADPVALQRHGRLPDAAWARVWAARVPVTRARALALLESSAGTAAVAVSSVAA